MKKGGEWRIMAAAAHGGLFFSFNLPLPAAMGQSYD